MSNYIRIYHKRIVAIKEQMIELYERENEGEPHIIELFSATLEGGV